MVYNQYIGLLLEIPYNEAIKFDTIVADILESYEEKSGGASVIGTIVSVESEASGSSISCIIKDKNNTTHYINVRNANIIDSTGNGRMILHEKDIVKVFYEKDKQANNDTIVAYAVFIKTAEVVKEEGK